jgi:zinc protease
MSWHEMFVKNKKPLVVIIGDSKGTSLASHFVQHFSGSRIQSITMPDKTVPPLDAGESIEQNWSRNRSAVLIGFQSPPEDDEDRVALTVLQSYAGGLGKFSEEIRDRKGLAFGITLEYNPLLRGSSMIAAAATSPGSEDAVLKSLQEEIRHIADGPILYRDYRAAVNAAVGAHLIRCQSRFLQIMDVAGNILAGKSIEEYQSFPARLQAVKQEDLESAAQRIFAMDKAVVLRLKGQKPPMDLPRE